jgi:hypothetical protein
LSTKLEHLENAKAIKIKIKTKTEIKLKASTIPEYIIPEVLNLETKLYISRRSISEYSKFTKKNLIS